MKRVKKIGMLALSSIFCLGISVATLSASDGSSDGNCDPANADQVCL